MLTHGLSRQQDGKTGRMPTSSHVTTSVPSLSTRSSRTKEAVSAQMLVPDNILALQRSIGNRAVIRALRQQAAAKQAAGQPMPARIQRTMENSFSADFSDVTIQAQSQRATTLGVKAFTQGNAIHFARGEFQPHTHTGRKLLGHELAHVVQNKQQRVRATTIQAKGIPIQVNDDHRLEQEADRLGEQAASGRERVGDHRAVQPRQPALPTTASSGVPLQFVIHKGKTHRSKVYEKLALSSWYQGLANDDERAFARLLHESDDHYTENEAEDEIRKRIANGDSVPTFDTDEKAERLKRVREYVNTNAPEETDEPFVFGNYLSQASERAYRRQRKKHLRSKRHSSAVKEINKTEPGLFKNQTPILSDNSPWEQMVALSESTPKSFNYDFGGVQIKLDSLDVKSNEDRSKKRKRDSINMAQTFIEQEGGDHSYWAMSDSRKKRKIDPAHRQLRSLEAERNKQSAFTTFMKDALYDLDAITNEQAFGDETPYAFQEYKGALNPTKAMQRMQTASSYRVLELAKNVKAELGTQVGKRARTTVKQIDEALRTFVNEKTETNYRALVKEIYRLIRAQTGADYASDSEPDSEDDYDSD